MTLKNNSTAILLISYGTPNSASKRDVRHYLSEMLDNNKVVTLPDFKRHLLVKCIIAPFRAKKSAIWYSKLEDSRGMPLRYHTEDLVEKLQQIFSTKADVYYAMMAGKPSIKSVCDKIFAQQYGQLIITPTFPHFTESTTGNAIGSVMQDIAPRFNLPEIYTINTFYDSPHYLNCMSQLITENLSGYDYDKIIFSYHGIPKKHAHAAHSGATCEQAGCSTSLTTQNSKCYVAQCYQTTKLLAKAAGIPENKAVTTFQSRFADRWVQPYTEQTAIEMAKNGIKKIAIVTPSFTADCLETTVEISQTLANEYITAGGQELKVVPCLNSNTYWAKAYANIICEKFPWINETHKNI